MTVQTMDSITPTETPQELPTSAEVQTPAQERQPDHQTAETPEAGQEPTEKESQPKKGVQKRFDELTFKVHQAAREAAYWRERATQQPGNSSQDAPKPARADFAADDDYFEALADYKAEQKVQQFSQQSQAERVQEAEARQSASRFELYQERVAQAAEAMPDYQTVVGESDVPIAPHVQESILESDVGPQLAYHLAKNPDVAERLSSMTPVQAAREIGRLEAQMATPPAAPATPTKRTTNAPAPITPTRGSGGQFTKSEAQMSDAEWYESQNT